MNGKPKQSAPSKNTKTDAPSSEEETAIKPTAV